MAGKCFVFGAGDFFGLKSEIGEEDYVIAADGGYKYCQDYNIKVDMVLGDFDSYGYVPDFPNIEVMPVEKDDTDLIHALKTGIQKGFTQFEIYGATGGAREDHTIANIQSLLYLAQNGARGKMYAKAVIYEVIKDETKIFASTNEGTISVFCLDGKAEGVTLEGLKYTVEDYTLTSYFPLGVSNSFTGREAKVTVKNGSLILIYEYSR